MLEEKNRWGRRDSPILYASYRRGKKPSNAGRRFPPEPLEGEEVLALMQHCGRGPGLVRNRALLAVMWRSGLRKNEALSLVPKDINFELGAIRVLHGKGDRDRLVHLDEQTAGLLFDWLRRRRQIAGLLPDDAPVFCTYERGIAGQALTGAYVSDMMHRAARRAGITKRVHPHQLRHTFAWEMRLEGWDMPTISESLGHRDIGTTYAYLNHLAPIDRVRQVSQRTWPSASPAGNAGRQPAAKPRNSRAKRAARAPSPNPAGRRVSASPGRTGRDPEHGAP